MEITEVRIFLKNGSDKKLKAYATVTFDNAFVVRNIKVIEGQKGLFVAMPSRKLKDPCPKCSFKNAVRSKFCNNCGVNLPISDKRPAPVTDINQKESEHRDIAHPITLECREYLQKKVLEAYDVEVKNPTPPELDIPITREPAFRAAESREPAFRAAASREPVFKSARDDRGVLDGDLEL
ncbi:MAG: septation protein SpoVG family protein [Candidatus Omnitrophota bacterium]